MRTRRAQRRRLAAALPSRAPGLPDPFSRLNDELVDEEERAIRDYVESCPCCEERQERIWLNHLERSYLALRGSPPELP